MDSLQKINVLRNNFPKYAKANLKIRTKSGKIEPFFLNKAQYHIHKAIQTQHEATGRVRAIILKGRQQGSSTYVEGRLYWKTSLNRGKRAFILTHEEEATKNLFDMAQRYHHYSQMKPSTQASNTKELLFDLLDSGYRVGTAGNKSVGRSSTIQYFHGSEVAFWAHSEEHAKGILQAIPDEPGTEIILESTANGLGNYYHKQWKAAETGQSEYIAIFVPWFWQEEYRKPIEGEFAPTKEEEELISLYELDNFQLNWRRNKIKELSTGGADGEAAFKQEYPMNPVEAFQTTGEAGLILPKDVIRARKNRVSPSGPLVVGVDPSRGGDRFTIIRRRGRKAYKPESYTDTEVDVLGKQIAKLVRILEDEKPSKMFVDAGGGSAIVDRLRELGHTNIVAVPFGGSPLREDRYRNKRAEMWGEMAEWIKDEALPVQIPDDDTIHADLLACPYERDSHDRIILWEKKKIKKMFGFSPDFGDALALTFAQPVKEQSAGRPVKVQKTFNPLQKR